MPGIWRRAVVLDTLMMASVVSCTLLFSQIELEDTLFHHLDRTAV